LSGEQERCNKLGKESSHNDSMGIDVELVLTDTYEDWLKMAQVPKFPMWTKANHSTPWTT